MSTVFVNGITVGYDDAGGGDGPPLLLVHGHPFDRTMWRPQTDGAFGGRRVIAPDLRGYGRSTVVPGRTGLDVFARDLAALLDALGVGPAVLCGLSMGGQIVLEFHRLFAERVAGLVLADTFAQGESEQGVKERYARADALERDGMAGYAHDVLDSMVAPATVAALPEVADHVRAMMLAAPPQGAAAALRGRAERPDYTGMLGADRGADGGRRGERGRLHARRRRAVPAQPDHRRAADGRRRRRAHAQPGAARRLQLRRRRPAGRRAAAAGARPGAPDVTKV